MLAFRVDMLCSRHFIHSEHSIYHCYRRRGREIIVRSRLPKLLSPAGVDSCDRTLVDNSLERQSQRTWA